MSLVDNDTRVIRKGTRKKNEKNKKNPRSKMEGGVTISRQHWNEEAVTETLGRLCRYGFQLYACALQLFCALVLKRPSTTMWQVV